MTKGIITSDRTTAVVRQNLARILLLAVAGPICADPKQADRVLRILQNRRRWNIGPPLLMQAVHNELEESAALAFQAKAKGLARFSVVRQNGHNESFGNAIKLFQRDLDPSADAFKAKRQCLLLSRRGGKGLPKFVSPFLGGQGTTCGEWTPPMVRKKDGGMIKGFMKASVAVGFCPVECPYCYLNMPYTDGMDVALNWEDLAYELKDSWVGFRHPINFGETSGLVEYDEWFAESDGQGSMIQYIIDACARSNVRPFFLTKIRYPRYLKFHGRVQVGISLMPEDVRRWLAPNGSPSDDLLDSLSWAVSAGGIDPVVRLTVIWQQRELYPQLLERLREKLGKDHWRLTLDILRFTPNTAAIISNRYPEAAGIFAKEIQPEGDLNLKELACIAKVEDEHAKKVRPSADRQAEIYTWFRQELNRLNCDRVLLTPCKGDPNELAPLVRQKILDSMPCACFSTDGYKKCSKSGSGSEPCK